MLHYNNQEEGALLSISQTHFPKSDRCVMTAQPGTPDSDFPSDLTRSGWALHNRHHVGAAPIKPLTPDVVLSPLRNDLVLNTKPRCERIQR